MIVNPILYQQGTKLPELTNPGTAADLLAGKQLVDQYGNPLTGTMPQRSAGNLTVSGAEIIVPAGYYPSQVSKSVPAVEHPKPTLSRSGGTVTATHVQDAGYTAGGTTTETLTIPTKAGTTITPGTSRKTAVSSGYLTTGAVYVAGDTNLKAENIKSGVSIFGVAGSASFVQKCNVTLRNMSGTIITYATTYIATTKKPNGYDMYGLMTGDSTVIEVANGGVLILDTNQDASKSSISINNPELAKTFIIENTPRHVLGVSIQGDVTITITAA